MIDCELWGRDCELAVKSPRKARKSAVRPDGGVVTQRTANPPIASFKADKFARFMVRSTRRVSRDLSAAANSTLRLRIRKGPARLAPNEAHRMTVGGSHG